MEMVMGVVDMEVGKLADEVTDMVADRTNFTDVALVLKIPIPIKDFTDVTLAMGMMELDMAVD